MVSAPKFLAPPVVRRWMHQKVPSNSTVTKLAAFAYGERPGRQVPWVSLPREDEGHASASPIPRIVWSTWDRNIFGKSHAQAILDFRERNPGYCFIVVGDHEADEFVRSFFHGTRIEAIYFASRFGPMKADILRYLLIYAFGGWYFDIKSVSFAPLEALSGDSESLVVTYDDVPFEASAADANPTGLLHADKQIAQWVLAGPVGHPFIAELLRTIVRKAPDYQEKEFPSPKSAILEFTGPVMFTRAIRQYIWSRGMKGIRQTDVSLDGLGEYEVFGGWVRHSWRRTYATAKNQPILRSIG